MVWESGLKARWTKCPHINWGKTLVFPRVKSMIQVCQHSFFEIVLINWYKFKKEKQLVVGSKCVKTRALECSQTTSHLGSHLPWWEPRGLIQDNMMKSITDLLSVKNLLLPLTPWRCTKTICNDLKISVRYANINKKL